MKKTLFVLGAFLSPAVIYAQTSNSSKDLGGLVALFRDIVTQLIPVASMLAILFFFYGLAIYILHAGDAEQAKEGKSIMIWGILALFVMTSIYGIIGFLQRTTGTDEAASPINVVTPDFKPANVL